MINSIWENAQNHKSAIRMAEDELQKMAALKLKVEEETAKRDSRKKDELKKQEQIKKLR